MQSRNRSIDRLVDVLWLEAKALDQMQATMAKNRSAFVAIGASRLIAGIESLEKHWNVIEGLEEKRETLLTEIAEEYRLQGRIRVSQLVGELSADQARRLRAAADAADAASRRVRAETTASARLLRVSQQAHDGVIRALTGGDSREHTGYDERARTVAASPAGGRLVLGTV